MSKNTYCIRLHQDGTNGFVEYVDDDFDDVNDENNDDDTDNDDDNEEEDDSWLNSCKKSKRG